MLNPLAAIKALIARSINSAAAWLMLGTALKAGAAILLLPLILSKLRTEELGLWYVFISIAAIASMIDMGLVSSIGRAVAYLWAGSDKMLAHGVEEIPECNRGKPNITMIIDLLVTFRYYYLAICSVLFLLLSTLGTLYVHEQVKTLPNSRWLVAIWIFYAAAQAIGHYAAVWNVTLATIGGINYGARAQVYGQLANLFISAVCLYLGAGLIAIVLGSVAGLTLTRWLCVRRAKAIIGIKHLPWGRFQLTFLATLWPQSWRVGITGIGLYFVSQGNTLICSTSLGLNDAASYALTAQVLAMLAGICAMLVDVKLPTMYSLYAQNKKEQLAELFAKRIAALNWFYIFGSLGILFVLPHIFLLLDSNTPLLPSTWIALFLFIQYFDLHQQRFGVLISSGNRNPMMIPYLISGAVNVIIASVLIRHYGSLGLIISQGIITAAFNNWWIPLLGLRDLRIGFTDYMRKVLRAMVRPHTILQA